MTKIDLSSITRYTDSGEFKQLREAYIAELAPRDLVETHLVDHIVHAVWNRRRLYAMETELWKLGQLDPSRNVLPAINRISSSISRLTTQHLNAVKMLQKFQKQPLRAPIVREAPLSTTRKRRKGGPAA